MNYNRRKSVAPAVKFYIDEHDCPSTPNSPDSIFEENDRWVGLTHPVKPGKSGHDEVSQLLSPGPDIKINKMGDPLGIQDTSFQSLVGNGMTYPVGCRKESSLKMEDNASKDPSSKAHLMVEFPDDDHSVSDIPIHVPYLSNPDLCESKLEKGQRDSNNNFVKVFSAIYGKVLVVMGMAFPLAEVISPHIPPSFYEAFYLYLYMGSIVFLLYVYIFLLGNKKFSPSSFARSRRESQSSFSSQDDTDVSVVSLGTKKKYEHWNQQFGSFYLRLGAVAFGVGSMIYSVLEFSQYFELNSSENCDNILLAITPAARVAFTFIQMYFIFLNSRILILKYQNVARFGLMHMIATNLCVWLNVLVQESMHEILVLSHTKAHENTFPGLPILETTTGHHTMASTFHNGTAEVTEIPEHDHVFSTTELVADLNHSIHRRSLSMHHSAFHCHRTNILGELVQNVSPFLFPCTIEYSLICAAILYVMWKNIGKSMKVSKPDISSFTGNKRSRHHYSVDCAGANKGLFVGLLVLVLSVISLILFFVFISKVEYYNLAVMESQISELILYALTSIAILIGVFRMRKMHFDVHRNMELDSILLVIAQTGLYIYSVFIIIGGYFMVEDSTVLMLVTGLAMLGQGTLQTIFILNASRRYVYCSNQIKHKPGREMVTFLLVSNLAMWAVNTFETSRSNAHPVQLKFYGLWGWTIIIHVSMPLAIFYRFHSTVCLCEIWSKSYKMRPVSI